MDGTKVRAYALLFHKHVFTSQNQNPTIDYVIFYVFGENIHKEQLRGIDISHISNEPSLVFLFIKHANKLKCCRSEGLCSSPSLREPRDRQTSVNIVRLLTTGNNSDQFSQGQTVI